ncbi:methyltransferase [Shewanella intestini]|uniref:Ribosomal RNA large subunit methyltransferase G n=1 Tax=Shewanella intestini TaxID=2017544 RepID=A0ABS5HXH2_9GAMM|nr:MULTISPECIES: methyltransferase [Shewanella]MBR9726387.1 methyltransferase [Shewanella intestini]MRG35047.1 methyltransferase [Shewanella sp. XMDDZSB0408]
MSTELVLSGITLSLSRYPAKHVVNLQAWDAADEHLLKHLGDTEQAVVNTHIINDSFGALTCGLLTLDEHWPLTVETDAKTSLLGGQLNLQQNQLPTEHIRWVNSRETLPSAITLVLMKLPKNLNYFAYQLAKLSQHLPQGTKVLIGAKAKSINKALLATIAQQLGAASASLTWKKTRVITCISDGNARALPQATKWQVPSLNLTMSNLSNVFSATKLDIGARIMLDNLPKGDFKQIVDLGCGNGILGLHAKQRYPKAHIHFVDDSEMAVASAQTNWQQNQLDNPEQALPQASFAWEDCLSNLSQDMQPDLILCNPPFHQGEAITDHIAWQMFVDAHKALASGGLLQVVGNRHLNYHIKLKRIFKQCKTLASNGKFVILQAYKE